MRRRKAKKVYYSSRNRSNTSDRPARSFSPTVHLRSALTSAPRPSSPPLPESFATTEMRLAWDLQAFRRVIQRTVTLNAVLSWAISFIGYWDVKERDEIATWHTDLVRALVCVISLAQVCLVCFYSSSLLTYSEGMRIAFKLGLLPVPPLLKSPQALCICLLECLFHLCIMPPRVSFQFQFYLFGTQSLLLVKDLLYVLILLRNYHTFQMLFWRSSLSTKTAYFFADFANVNFNFRWVLKGMLTTYAFRLILAVYGAVVLVNGLVAYILEKGTQSSSLDSVANGMWLVSVTQAIIGYGDITPMTFFGQLSLLFNCFFGSFCLSMLIGNLQSHVGLNLLESRMYSELAYARFKRKYEKQAVLLLQKWWKFMQMRHRGPRDGHVIIAFYSQLRVYGWIISKGQRVKDSRFERQIDAFGISTACQFRSITEYLQPVPSAEALVIPTQTLDIIRSEYRIKLQVKRISQFARKHRPRHRNLERNCDAASASSVSIASPSPEPSLFRMSPRLRAASPSSTSGGRKLARAKLKAYHKLRGRLIREEPGTASRCGSPSSIL